MGAMDIQGTTGKTATSKRTASASKEGTNVSNVQTTKRAATDLEVLVRVSLEGSSIAVNPDGTITMYTSDVRKLQTLVSDAQRNERNRIAARETKRRKEANARKQAERKSITDTFAARKQALLAQLEEEMNAQLAQRGHTPAKGKGKGKGALATPAASVANAPTMSAQDAAAAAEAKGTAAARADKRKSAAA